MDIFQTAETKVQHTIPLRDRVWLILFLSFYNHLLQNTPPQNRTDTIYFRCLLLSAGIANIYTIWMFNLYTDR